MLNKMTIEVKTQFEGIHCWPNAPAEVAFLRNMHRHMFHVTLRIPVSHGDRDLEFIMVKRALDEHIRSSNNVDAHGTCALGRLSCEDIAANILKWVKVKYDKDVGVEVGVSEDDENGCWVVSGELCMSERAVDFDKYQRRAYTAIQKHGSIKEEEMHWALGLGEEAGEVLGVIKHRHYGGEFTIADLAEELGDVLWHVAAICTAFGIDMSDVAQYNLMKLANRYPTGSFDVERSNNRHQIAKQFRDDPDVKSLVEKMESDHTVAYVAMRICNGECETNMETERKDQQ